MERTDYTVTEERDGMVIEKYLMEYSEEEAQTNKVNENNAKKVFSPKFIPVYPALLKHYTLTEALLCGFIDFYLSNSSERFYFTDSQLAAMFNCAEKTITRAMKTLEDTGFIKRSRQRKSTGFGKIRFVTKNEISIEQFVPFHIEQNVPRNNNTIKDNKSIIHSTQWNVLQEEFGIDKEQIQDWFEFKKSLDRIEQVCQVVREISSAGGIEPVYNKDTINLTDIALNMGYTAEHIIQYGRASETFANVDNYQDFCRQDYYLIQDLQARFG